jgi:hypothetical protein
MIIDNYSFRKFTKELRNLITLSDEEIADRAGQWVVLAENDNGEYDLVATTCDYRNAQAMANTIGEIYTQFVV